MNRQEYYRHAYRCLCPEWQDSLTIYRELIERHMRRDSRILDLGCGSADFLRTTYARAQEVLPFIVYRSSFILHLDL